jgi:glycosyltransferase involved in cell wall biosynthesis
MEVMSSQDRSISVFFPAYNDEGTIVSLVEEALRILPLHTSDYEVVVVNDGSTDSTKILLDELAARSNYVKIIHHEKNCGYGAALITGFKHAEKELIFYTDGDGQYSVDDISGMIPLMKENIDVVNGYKIDRGDKLHRKIIGSVYNFMACTFFGLPIRDIDCDFRLIRKCAIRKIDLKSTSGVICVELIYELHALGCNFAEFPVNHYKRKFGISQFFTFSRVSRTLIAFCELWVKMVVIRRLRKLIHKIKTSVF